MKQCKKCKEFKNESKFNKCKTSKDGLEGSCKICRKYRPQHICSKCNELKKIATWTEDKCYCQRCYDLLGLQPQYICFKCNELKIINKWYKNKGYCQRCYDLLGLQPLHICSKCNKLKKINKWYKNKGYCFNCYMKKRYLEDIIVNIKIRLRNDVSRCFKYKGIKKIHKSKEYGIDFDKIKKHIGPPPNETDHLDHIFPLKAFDYNDEFQIKASFHYTNFQWLTAEENLKKGAKYNKEEFEKYLDDLRGKI